ncbi:MAG: 3-hydroxyacyl-CoA dehydrogenase/enoyl-CoA hydratase family protein [Gammaproteobacteria bacterium]
MSQPFHIRKVAVLGSGVMGAQIAAHMVNAGVPALLFDLPATSNNLNQIAENGIQTLLKLSPPPLTVPDNVNYLQPCNYAEDLNRLSECDLVIEAISENIDIKLALYEQVAPYISAPTVFVTNTSGLSINRLSQALPENLRSRFFGVHFFNPPRYMTLVELIPSVESDLQLVEQVETFLVCTLGKGVVYSQDTPNFVANRIGIFSMLMTLHFAEKYNLGLDVVDALTGPLIGRPKSATLRTADVVGLDTFLHAVDTMTTGLPNDPWHSYFKLPEWMLELIKNGALGQKTRKGVYLKKEDGIYVYDCTTHNYRPATGDVSEEIKQIFSQANFTDALGSLRNSKDPQAQFLWSCFREVFHYSAYHLQSIASTSHDLDCAMRWGFGWKQGPFEIWQQAGWHSITEWIKHDIRGNQASTQASLPDWVENIQGVYAASGAYAPETRTYMPRRPVPVYERQIFPELMPEELPITTFTLFENEGVHLWHTGDEIAVLSFKTKLGSIDNFVLDGILTSLQLAEGLGRGLILWNNSSQFSVGANLRNILQAAQENRIKEIEQLLENFQKCTAALKYSPIPTVAAVRGFVLGGGCESMLYCDRVVAALESTIGLVETGVGLVPAGGGCALMVQRAWEILPDNPYPLLEKYYLQITDAYRPINAVQAYHSGYLRSVDKITFNPYELLFLAKEQIENCLLMNYRAPMPTPNNKIFAGDYKQALYQAWQTKHPDGSKHSAWVAHELAHIFGNPIPENMRDIETEIFRRERETFITLVQTKETQDRIDYMLRNGKPLNN